MIKLISGYKPEIHKGRDVRAGNIRAYGLECENLLGTLWGDPLFIESVKKIIGNNMVTALKLANIYLIMSNWLPQLGPGDIIEFGSYRGGCAVFMALVARELKLPIHIYGLDTFNGMPKTNKKIDHHKSGDFSNTSLEGVQKLAASFDLKNITFVPGLFQETAEKTLSNCKPILIAHIDCDIESGVRYSYDTVKDHMIDTGGYIVFDDPLHGSCLGAFQVIEDCLIRRDKLSAEQAYPHLVYRYPKLKNDNVKTNN